MANLRDAQQNDLKAVRDDWWIPVRLTAPGGVKQEFEKGSSTVPLLGDVRKESKEFDPELGGTVLVKRTVITLRLKDLVRIPKENETWYAEYPDDLLDSGTLKKAAFSPNNVASAGDTMGFIKLFLQEAAL